MHRFVWIVAVATLLVGLALAAAVPDKADARFYFGGEDHTLTVRHSGMCLDREFLPWLYFTRGVKSFNQADGAGVVQSVCTGVETPSRICIVPSACAGAGTNQGWQVDLTGITGPVKLRNKQSGKCLDIAGASLVNYTNVVQMPCVETDSQLWYATNVQQLGGIPYYVFENVLTGKCLEVA